MGRFHYRAFPAPFPGPEQALRHGLLLAEAAPLVEWRLSGLDQCEEA